MADIKDRAREYLAKNSEYNEVYGEFFVAVDTMTAMIEFAEQETKLLSKHILELQADKGRLTDRVRELEKENAELKHTIATLRQEKDNVSMHAKSMEVVAKTRSDQLTKAKELLKQWLQTSKASSCDNINIVTDTEQFLNSEVEKNGRGKNKRNKNTGN